jgi:hypothetical protein
MVLPTFIHKTASPISIQDGEADLAMASGQGLPRVSPRPAMPYPSKPCGRATPVAALRSFQRWPVYRARSLRLRASSTFLDTPRGTPKSVAAPRHRPTKSIHFETNAYGNSRVSVFSSRSRKPLGWLHTSWRVIWVGECRLQNGCSPNLF